jgi:hypothetical protein
VVFSFSSKYFLFSYDSLVIWKCDTFQTHGDFPQDFILMISSLILFMSGNILYRVSILLNLRIFFRAPNTGYLSDSFVLEKDMYFAIVGRDL